MQKTIRRNSPILLVAVLLSVGISKLYACSTTEDCPHDGFEAARNFTVTVRHAGNLLKGAHVDIYPDSGGGMSGITEAEGVVQFEDLRPGKYHISVSMLGLTSVYQCFHVAKWTTGRRAKHALTFSWGDGAPQTRRIAGKLISNHVLVEANVTRSDPASVAGIHLTLTHALTGVQYEETSKQDGVFLFNAITEGVYALHSDGNKEFDHYPGAIIVNLSPTAARSELRIQLGGGGGDCRNPLELAN